MYFVGGLKAYSSPVPDLLGNGSSQPVLWEEQSQGLLTDGSFGLQDIHTNSILTYGKLFSPPPKSLYGQL